MDYYLKNEDKDDLYSYLSFIDMLGKKISSYISAESPILLGNWEKDYNKKIESLELSDFGMNIEVLAEHIAEYFKGVIRWHYPLTLYNVKTPINIYAAAVSALTMLYDGNLAEDKDCGNMASAEFEVVKYLSDAVGWDYKKSGGYFTFGGTSILLNATKLGINKAISDVSRTGIKDNLFIICSQQEHHSILKVCNWLGIGKDNCIMVPTDNEYCLDVTKAEEIIIEKIGENKKLVAIIACGGTTIQSFIDPIYEIKLMCDRVVEKFGLDYYPHIHVDSVIAWPLLFFNGYSFDKNPLNFDTEVIKAIEPYYQKIKGIQYADSFGADFHKTGFCPFASSVLIVKNEEDLLKLNGDLRLNTDSFMFGEYNAADYVLECSRSTSGVMSALSMLKLLGKNGIRTEFAKITKAAIKIRRRLGAIKDFEIINPLTFGINILFIVKPPNFEINYNELSKLNLIKAYRFADYNYNFYLYCLKQLSDKRIIIDYSSGYDRGKDGVFMGVLKIQSFSPMIEEQHIDDLMKLLQKLKVDYDQNYEKDKEDTHCAPKTFRFTYNTK